MRYVLLAFALLFSVPVAMAQDEAPAPSEEVAAPAEEAPAKVDAPAEAETPSAESVEEAVEAVSDEASVLVDAIQSKNWALVLGMLLSLLVAVANKFGLKDKVGGKAVPWVTSAVAVAGAIGASLMAGISVMEAVSQGLVAGVAAIGGWEMVLKHILAPKSDPAPAE
ncbi:MAG: hypothetical protein CMJ67_10530 [Planctomycetaceae bacterium]|nr:hypothetical protein [Planctomycetaceae bacterium]